MSELTGIAYGLPFEEYRKAEGINCSGLKRILQSPLHYKSELEQQREETKSMMIGTAVHCAILEPHLFESQYGFMPEGLDKRTKEGKSAFAELEQSGKIILSYEDYREVCRIAISVQDHDTAGKLFSSGHPEVSVFAEIDNIKAKVRMDWLRNIIVDLKTTDDASPEGFARSIAKFSYDMQAAWYLDCANAAGIDVNTFLFVAVEKSAPYAIGIYELDHESIEIGRAKCRKALNLYRYCKENNDWFGYSPDIITLSLPRWAKMKEDA
jgi:hypothetical protein